LPAVFAEKLHKTYFTRAGNVDALRGIDLSIEAGEFVAIMGPSGCGKTTLLNCLSGLDKPDKGKVLVDGIAIHELRDRELSEFRARKMGFVFQSFDLIPEFSALENVELPMLLGGSSPKEARRAAEAILQKLGMSDRLHHRPTQLSGGEQQRVAIARAVVHRPAVVWADEPTGNLDSANSKSVMRLLSQLNSEGQTIVVVTHDPEVAGVAKRRLVMRDGQIVSDET
jgi:putative ABC transport system ATP-binding protein